MAIYRNEELSIGNHIAIPCYSNFTGSIIELHEIEKVTKTNMGSLNELKTTCGFTYHLRNFSDFSDYKDIC